MNQRRSPRLPPVHLGGQPLPLAPEAGAGLRRRPRTARSIAIGALSLTVGSVVAVTAAPAGAARTPVPTAGEAYVVQGLDGEAFDIVVDGDTVARAAPAKAVVGPIDLDSGTHVVQLRRGATVVLEQRFTVAAGQSVDVVAHKRSDAAMTPTLTTYRNDTSPVGPGKLRLAVAHTAAAPPADIRVDGKVLFSNVANAETLNLLVPAGAYTIDIVPSGTDGTPILGPVDLPLKGGTLTRVFAVGSVTTGKLDAVVHALPIGVAGSDVPRTVRTGDGGQAATAFVEDGPSPLAVGSLALVLVALGGAGAASVRRRDRSLP